jgi:peptidoglycan/LPS O-acetylase OafA/YrhL
MAVRGAGAARRRRARRVALVCFALGLVAGVVIVLVNDGGAGGAVLFGLFLGAVAAGIGTLGATLQQASQHGPPGQH